MLKWKSGFNPENLYFATITTISRRRLFRKQMECRVLVDCLDWVRLQHHIELYTFVVMPNHVHLILRAPNSDELEEAIEDFKSFTTDRLIRHFRVERDQKALDFLMAVEMHPAYQQHRLWDIAHRVEPISSPDGLIDKIAYVHSNPCKPHWALALNPDTYPWSGARFYIREEPAVIPLEHVACILA
jgi:putative transposase